MIIIFLIFIKKYEQIQSDKNGKTLQKQKAQRAKRTPELISQEKLKKMESLIVVMSRNLERSEA